LHRADRLARRVLALHARHRLVIDLGVLPTASVVAIDAQPVHLALAVHFLLADDGDVVLRLTRHHAAVAAGADRGVDDHRPGVALVLEGGVHRLRAALVLARVLPERLAVDDAAVAAGVAEVEALVLLRAGDGVGAFVGERHDHAGSAAEGVGEAERIDVDADAALGRAGDPAAVPAAVAELRRDHTEGMAGH